MPFQPLEQILDHWQARCTDPLYRHWQKLLQSWAEIVGPVVAAQTYPVALHRGTLRVATSSSAWAQSLTFERYRILTKLNTTLALALVDIRFIPGQDLRSLTLPSPLTESGAHLGLHHPSRVPGVAARPLLSASLDPQTAFQRWATHIQQRGRSLPLCSQCHCPTPPGELKRWSVCALCAAKQWSTAPPSLNRSHP